MSKFLNEVGSGKEFLCKDGRIIRTLEDLMKIVKDLSQKDFLHHVNKERNDFATWIRDVVGDFVLANRLKRVKGQSTMSKLIEKRIFELNFN
jgi:hypothetical protein